MSDSDLDLVWRGDVLRVLREHGMTDADPAVRALLALPAVVRDIGPVPRDRDADTATAKKALDDYLAGRQDSRGNPTPAPAECPASAPAKCKACDGSRRQGGWGDISDTPCPCCWPAPEKCATCSGLGRSVPHKPECPDINEPQFGEMGGLLFCGKCETMRDICPACRGTGRKP